jgi:hypothetical protein
MSVFQRPGSPNWFIKFTYKGEMVRKSSGVPLTQPKSEAEQVEQKWREEIIQKRLATGHVQTITKKLAATRRAKVRPPPELAKAVAAAGGYSELARRLGVPLSTVHGWARRRRVSKWYAKQIAALTEKEKTNVHTPIGLVALLLMPGGRPLADWTIGELRALNGAFADILAKAGASDDSRTVRQVLAD